MTNLREALNLQQNHPILVCEGEADLQFLQRVLEPVFTDLYIIAAFGKDAVSPLTSAIREGVYFIKDRDFDLSPDKAYQTFQNRKAATFWTHHEIESYLLYSDWLWEFVQKHQRHLLNPPPSQKDIEADLHEIAHYFSVDHAGQQCLKEINRRANPTPSPYEVTRKKEYGIVRNAEASPQVIWEECLRTEATNLLQQGQKLGTNSTLEWPAILSEFEAWIETYKERAQDLNELRVYFAGKRILQALALKWQLKTRGRSGKPWELLREELISSASQYATQIPPGELMTDPRLGDFGRLGAKILGQPL